jgi:hypothetical protein
VPVWDKFGISDQFGIDLGIFRLECRSSEAKSQSPTALAIGYRHLQDSTTNMGEGGRPSLAGPVAALAAAKDTIRRREAITSHFTVRRVVNSYRVAVTPTQWNNGSTNSCFAQLII